MITANMKRHIEQVLLDYMEFKSIYFDFAEKYCEPGYDANNGYIIFANWNHETEKRIGDVLEKLGHNLEWSDEWANCADCLGAIRTSPDCYHWSPYYVILSGDLVCLDCAREDLETLIEEYQNRPEKALPVDITHEDLVSIGFTRWNDDPYESGFHSGQDDDPKEIMRNLSKAVHCVFRISEVSQFYICFDLYTRKKDQ